MLVRSELEVGALRQQIEECLDYLRIQHEIVGEALAEARPLVVPSDGYP
jgi:hypothetical protein